MHDMDELMRAVLAILPNATFDQDNDGQVIVYTDKVAHSDNSLSDLPPEGD